MTTSITQSHPAALKSVEYLVLTINSGAVLFSYAVNKISGLYYTGKNICFRLNDSEALELIVNLKLVQAFSSLDLFCLLSNVSFLILSIYLSKIV